MEGIRAMVEMSKNRESFIGLTPARYVSGSFGVPGMKNKKNVTLSI